MRIITAITFLSKGKSDVKSAHWHLGAKDMCSSKRSIGELKSFSLSVENDTGDYISVQMRRFRSKYQNWS